MKHLRLAAAATAALLLAACADTASITAPKQTTIDAPRRSTGAAADSTKSDNGGMFGSGLRTTSGDNGGVFGSGGQSATEVTDGGGMFGGGL